MPVKIRQLISRSPTRWVRAWLKVLGPPFIALTIVVSLLGGAISFYETGRLYFVLWFLSALSLVLIHFGTSSLNDYFDFLSGTDNINIAATPFSGGSRVIQEGSLTPGALLAGGILFIGIGAVIGVYLAVLKGWFVLFLGACGVFFAVGYVHPKINLSKRGLGELSVAFSFGPIMLSGVYYVQTQMVSFGVALIGVIMGLLAGTVLWINEIPDYEADKTTGKTNWVVRVGKKKAASIYVILLSLIYVATLGLILKGFLPKFSCIVFVTLPLAFNAWRTARRFYNDVERLLPANAMTIALTILYGLLLSVAFFIAKLIS